MSNRFQNWSSRLEMKSIDTCNAVTQNQITINRIYRKHKYSLKVTNLEIVTKWVLTT